MSNCIWPGFDWEFEESEPTCSKHKPCTCYDDGILKCLCLEDPDKAAEALRRENLHYEREEQELKASRARRKNNKPED